MTLLAANQSNKDFNPVYATRVGSRDDDGGSSDDELYTPSGGGILTFSPDKAGLDVTPANFDFARSNHDKRSSTGAFAQITGQ